MKKYEDKERERVEGDHQDGNSHLVCPTRCTRPIACSSDPMFSNGSTSSTCVASTIFNPFDPDENNINATFSDGLDLNFFKLRYRNGK